MFTRVRSVGIPSRVAADSMIRTLAWWGANHVTSSTVTPARFRAAVADSTTMRTARRKTSGPAIFR